MMKFLYTFILPLSVYFLTFSLSAQDADTAPSKESSESYSNNDGISRDKLDIRFEVRDIKISDDTLSVNDQVREAVLVDIPEADVIVVKKDWQRKIKKKTKSKVLETGDLISIQGTNLTKLSETPMDIYSKVIDSEYGTKIYASFVIDSAFLTQEDMPSHYSLCKNFVNEFAISQYQLFTKQQIREEQGKLDEMERVLSKYQRDNEKMHKSVSDNKVDIQNIERDIEQNLKYQDAAQEKIRNQKDVVSVAQGEFLKTATKQLKEYEREHKKLQKDNKNMHKKIIEDKSNIEALKRKIKLNLSEQDHQKEIIDKQVSVVKSLERKLDKIK